MEGEFKAIELREDVKLYLIFNLQMIPFYSTKLIGEKLLLLNQFCSSSQVLGTENQQFQIRCPVQPEYTLLVEKTNIRGAKDL